MSDEPATNGTAWRLTALESRMAKIESYEPAVLAERTSTHMHDMTELKEEIRSLRRALYSFALSIAAAAVVFGFTVMQVVR